jgi:hypothetical protein
MVLLHMQYDGTAIVKRDCSGGGRLVHIEHLKANDYGGTYAW